MACVQANKHTPSNFPMAVPIENYSHSLPKKKKQSAAAHAARTALRGRLTTTLFSTLVHSLGLPKSNH